MAVQTFIFRKERVSYNFSVFNLLNSTPNLCFFFESVNIDKQELYNFAAPSDQIANI